MWRIVVSVLLLFGLSGLGVFGYRYYQFSSTPAGSGTEAFVVEIHSGETLANLNRKLAERQLNFDPLMRRLWIRRHRVEKKLRIGEFEIQPQWSASQILNHIYFGTPLSRSLTFKEGSNLYDLEALLKEKGIAFRNGDFQSWIRKENLLNRMEVPKSVATPARTLEGFFFPETYSYFKSDSAEILLESMLTQYQRRIRPLLERHPWGKTAEGRFKLLTLASIVEKESGNFIEQPVVASVFWNRIERRMRLESDPTIIYGMLPNFDGNIRRGDIRAPSLWNTYVVRGLPAGPIANPGIKAIEAVLDPAQTDYLFFVSKGDGDHVFSSNYKDHSENVRRYQLKR